MPEHRFTVRGTPATQGSKSLVRTRRGRTFMIESSRRVKPWRSLVASAASASGVRRIDGPVRLDICVTWARPASHLRADGSVKASAPRIPGYGDCDKLARAICDALAGLAYHNDRQVSDLRIRREWGDADGAEICIYEA